MGWFDSFALTRLPRYWPKRFPDLNRHRRVLWDGWVRARCQPVWVGDDTVLATVLGHFKMYLDARDMSLAAHLMKDGYWEIGVTEALSSLLRRRMVACDVGANHGYFTLVMAEKCLGGQVHSFECNPRMGELLRRNILVNGIGDLVTRHDLALGAEDGRELYFVWLDDLSGGGHLVPADEIHERRHLVLHTRRLDQIEGARDADVVKIDAEGSELRIWEGMAGMIAGTRLHIVLLEFAPVRYPDPAAFLRRITDAGFSLGYIDDYRGIVSASADTILGDRSRHEWMLLLRR
jgi:FkbM family methyltransferase